MAQHASVLGLVLGAVCYWALTPAFVVPKQQSNDKFPHGLPDSVRSSRAIMASQSVQNFPASSPGHWNLLCRLSAAAACAVMASVARKQRAEKVVVHMYPTRSKSRQKQMRRLEPYGEMPAWSRKPLLRPKLKQPWRKRNPKRLSNKGRWLFERSRLRYHFNITVHQLNGYVRRAFKEGRKRPIDHLMAILESRLDNFLWRVGIAPTMAAARWMVTENHMQVKSKRTEEDYKDPEWVTVNVPSHLLKIGDEIRVRPKPKSQKLAKRNQEEDGEVDIPDHLEWDREELIGTYNDICDSNQVGIRVNEDYLANRFIGPYTGVKQAHDRWFPGTTIPIPKTYNGGRIRPTPENILNMKMGRGMNPWGYRRPPSLWGRKKKPLNDPWEEPSKLKV